jgi:hypothetical protein
MYDADKIALYWREGVVEKILTLHAGTIVNSVSTNDDVLKKLGLWETRYLRNLR